MSDETITQDVELEHTEGNAANEASYSLHPGAFIGHPFTVSIVIPAFNEGPRVGNVVRQARAACPNAEIIVVDDASTDNTAEEAVAAGARLIRRPHNNGGPGAPLKAGFRAACGDVIVVLDCDGQHDPADIPRLLAHIGAYDMVIATRPDRASHENLHRWLGNALLNRLGSYLVEMEMQDLTSGFRAMRREVVMEFIHLLPNGFSWAMTSALAFVKGGYHIRFEPVPMQKRQGGKSTQKLFRNGIRFGLIILRMISLFAPLRVYFPVAVGMFLLGLLSFLISYFVTDPFRFRIPNSAVALFVGSVVVFMFGLIAEQVAALRFGKREP